MEARVKPAHDAEATGSRTLRPQLSNERASSPAFFGRPREGRSPFPFPERGNGAPGGAKRAVLDPLSGHPCARGRSTRLDGARALRVWSAAPPGAPFGWARRPAADAGCLPARRSATDPPRLETGEDRKRIPAIYSSIGELSGASRRPG